MGRAEFAPEPTLADGSGLHHAFLAEKLVTSPQDNQDAKNRLEYIADFDPEGVIECAGKSPEEARKILEEIEKRMKKSM